MYGMHLILRHSSYNSLHSRTQYAVLTKGLGVKKLFCVVGFSMGGQQAYYWPVVYPDFVGR